MKSNKEGRRNISQIEKVKEQRA